MKYTGNLALTVEMKYMSKHSYCKDCSRCEYCDPIGHLVKEVCRKCRESKMVKAFRNALGAYAQEKTKKGQLARDVLREFKDDIS